MQNPHNELPTHAGDGKAKVKDEHAHDHSKKHPIPEPDKDHKKELLEKMRTIKPKE